MSIFILLFIVIPSLVVIYFILSFLYNKLEIHFRAKEIEEAAKKAELDSFILKKSIKTDLKKVEKEIEFLEETMKDKAQLKEIKKERDVLLKIHKDIDNNSV